MTKEEHLVVAYHLKMEGTDLFQQGLFQEAAIKYKQAANYAVNQWGLARLHCGLFAESKQDLMAAYGVGQTNKDVL